MISVNPSCILILWLASTWAVAAPLGSSEKDLGQEIAPSMAPAEHMPNDLDRQTSTPESEDIIMKRLRVIVDELKREGPPPVGCMEG